MGESDLPAVIDVTGYAIAKMSGDDFREIVSENISGGTIGPFGLDRAKVPSGGGTFWSVPDISGAFKPEGELEGVIIFKRPSKSFWAVPFDKRGGENRPPDCMSRDGLFGVGTPGGACANCEFNEFGSASNGQAGKACRDSMMLFLLRKSELLPLTLIVPTMSVRPLDTYFKRLTSKGILYYGVVTGLSLEEATSSGGIKYARIKPRLVGVLPPEQVAVMREANRTLRPYLDQAQVFQSDLYGTADSD
jgi:hypothetical protein